MPHRDDELGAELRRAFGADLPGEEFDSAVMKSAVMKSAVMKSAVMKAVSGAEHGSDAQALGEPERPSRRPSPWLMPVVAIAALLLVAVLVWARAPDEASERIEADRAVPTEGERFSATVTDEAGKPVAGAIVLGVVKSWPGGRYQQVPYEGKTDGKGRFTLKHERPETGKFAVAAAVFVPGHAFQSHYEFLKEGTPMTAASFSLLPAHPIRLRFVAKDGAPAEGATALPTRRQNGTGPEHMVYQVAAAALQQTSDEEGLVTLRCFATGDAAEITYHFPGGVSQTKTVEIKGSDDEVIELRQEDDQPPPVGPTPGPHVAQEDLRAGKDEGKRYFLIGPKDDAREPAKGFGLLLILPGGGGGADFNPFVKRILLNALDDTWLIAQPVAVKWTADQQIVWPTAKNKVKKQKFSTEAFIDAVVKDASARKKIDPKRVFALGWSSSGPALYAASLARRSRVKGYYIAMSVFKPDRLGSLKGAKGKPYFILHSEDDKVCPYWMAEKARDQLKKKGAKVEFVKYPGGHGWHGDVYGTMRRGVAWLEKSAR